MSHTRSVDLISFEARPSPSIKISVAISSGASGFPGGQVIQDLKPTGYDLIHWYPDALYIMEVHPFFLYDVKGTGNHTIYVVEMYKSYGHNVSEMWKARKSVNNVRMVSGVFKTGYMTAVKVQILRAMYAE
ncbi:hypothetical protein C8R44DRAFT_737983 [Mycena epipterygia]|nr:hypothetical protein C8R44DRAFT_737983 [Mycena epipterygia]